jgi:hypothetical protein
MASIGAPVTRTILNGPADPKSGARPVQFLAQCHWGAAAGIDASSPTSEWIGAAPNQLPPGTVIDALVGWGFSDASGQLVDSGPPNGAAQPILSADGTLLLWAGPDGTVGNLAATITAGAGQTFFLNLACHLA